MAENSNGDFPGASPEVRETDSNDAKQRVGESFQRSGGASPKPVDQLIGKIIDDKYELIALLGEGAMASVYRARRVSLAGEVAVKLLHAHLMGSTKQMARFQQEAKAVSLLSHPNIARIYSFGIFQDNPPRLYFSMDLLDGHTLADHLSRFGPMPESELVRYALKLLDALACAHEAGLIHRDIKPGNIVLERVEDSVRASPGADPNELEPKLVDFGIARVASEADQKLTQTGHILGSPAYMSPEQCSSAPLDARSDLYSFSCVLYECLSGEPPFEAESLLALMNCHINEPITKIEGERLITADLEAAIIKGLQKDPAKRFSSAREFHDYLGDIVPAEDGRDERRGWTAKRIRVALSRTAIGLCVFLGAIFAWWQSPFSPWALRPASISAWRAKAFLKQAEENLHNTNSWEKRQALVNKSIDYAEKWLSEQDLKSVKSEDLMVIYQKLARLYFAVGKNEKSDAFLNKSEELADALLRQRHKATDSDVFGALLYLSEVRENTGNNQKALALLSKAAENCEINPGLNTKMRIDVLNRLSQLQMKVSDTSGAERSCFRALEYLRKNGKESSPYLLSEATDAYAEKLIFQGKTKQALLLLETNSKNTWQDSSGTADLPLLALRIPCLRAERNLSQLQKVKGELERRFRQEVDNPNRAEAMALERTINRLSCWQEPRLASLAYKQLLSSLDKGLDGTRTRVVIGSLCKMGNFAANRGMYEFALGCFIDSYDYANSHAELQDLKISALSGIIGSLICLERFDKILLYLPTYEALLRSAGPAPTLKLMNSYLEVYQAYGQYAAKNYEESARLALRCIQKLDREYPYLHDARAKAVKAEFLAYKAMGKWREAIESRERAIAALPAQSYDLTGGQLEVLRLQGLHSMELKDYARAERIFLQALAVVNPNASNRVPFSELSLDYAKCLVAQARTKEAETRFEELGKRLEHWQTDLIREKLPFLKDYAAFLSGQNKVKEAAAVKAEYTALARDLLIQDRLDDCSSD